MKTAPRSLLPAALLSLLVGLAGCHISIGSGSSNPNGVHGKPARHSHSSSSSASSGRTSKPLPKKSTKPAAAADPEPTRDVPDDKTTDDGPHRDQPASNPKRTKPATDPSRTEPSSDPSRTDTNDPVRTPKHIGSHTGGNGVDDAGDAGNESGPVKVKRPGSLTAPQ